MNLTNPIDGLDQYNNGKKNQNIDTSMMQKLDNDDSIVASEVWEVQDNQSEEYAR